jgi:hypothetical protein
MPVGHPLAVVSSNPEFDARFVSANATGVINEVIRARILMMIVCN